MHCHGICGKCWLFFFTKKNDLIEIYTNVFCGKWVTCLCSSNTWFFTCKSIRIKHEVYRPGRSLEHFAPIKTNAAKSYFSLARLRLYKSKVPCKHQSIPGPLMDFMTFAFHLTTPASLTHIKSVSMSELQKKSGDVFTNQRGWRCQGWLRHRPRHSAEGTCYSSGQSPDHSAHSFTAVTLNISNGCFFAKSEHIHKLRDHLRTKPVQGKACFYFGTAAWSKRVQIPRLSQLDSVCGGGLKHRFR